MSDPATIAEVSLTWLDSILQQRKKKGLGHESSLSPGVCTNHSTELNHLVPEQEKSKFQFELSLSRGVGR